MSNKKDQVRLIDESVAVFESVEWNETSDGAKTARITIHGITADLVNGNKRLYPKSVLQKAVGELAETINSTSAKSARMLVTGEVDHPSSKNTTPRLGEAVVLWETIDWSDEKNGPILIGETFPTARGLEFAEVAKFLYAKGRPLPVSQRGYGKASIIEIDGQQVEQIDELHITGYDFVVSQSDQNAQTMRVENEENEEIMADITLDALKEKHADLLEQYSQEKVDTAVVDLNQKLVEAQSKIDELAQAKDAELEEERNSNREVMERLEQEKSELNREVQWLKEREEEAKRQQEIAAWLSEAVASLPESYPAPMRDVLGKLSANSLEDIKTIYEARVKEYEPIVAMLQEQNQDNKEQEEFMSGQDNAQRALDEKGFDTGKIDSVTPGWEDRVKNLGLKLDENTGPYMDKVLHVLDRVEQSAAGSLNFSVDKPRNNSASKLAVEMLERYMFNHSAQIAMGAAEWDAVEKKREDARRRGVAFDEAPTLRTAYNLPYLVMAGVVPEVYASLVSPDVFTVMPLNNETQRYYVESWGSTPSAAITDEAVTSDEGAWVALAHPFISKSSVVVTDNAGTTTFDEYDDYVVDTEAGRLWTITGGAIGDGTALKVDYTYKKIAEGENAPIEFVSTAANYATLVVTAKRLGFNLSDEAIKFAMSDIGYDSRASHLANATYRLAQELDMKLFELAETHAYIAGTKTSAWNSTPQGSDTIDENLRKLVDRIADAVGLLDNYYFRPTHIAMARSLALKFHRTDLLDADVQRNGIALDSQHYAGMLLGLPVFTIPYGQYNASNVLVLSGKDTVVKGIYSPLEIVGGEGFINRATSGDVNRLVAARAWYVQEYYDVVVPVDPTDSNLTRKIAVVPVV